MLAGVGGEVNVNVCVCVVLALVWFACDFIFRLTILLVD